MNIGNNKAATVKPAVLANASQKLADRVDVKCWATSTIIPSNIPNEKLMIKALLLFEKVRCIGLIKSSIIEKYIRFVLPNKKLAYQGFLFSLNFGEHKYKSTKPCTKTGFTKKNL